MNEWLQRSERLGRNERLVPYILAVLLLPLLVLWRGDNVLYSPPRFTDPWFYLGFFKTLVNFQRDVFPGTYYGSRLAWILPGYLLHAVFPPVVANAILHLAVHLLSALSLFTILRLTAGVRSAFLATMVFAVHPWLWAATGWDYVNGAGIAWLLLALALATRAALQPERKWSLVLAGAALAAMVHSTFTLLAFAPLVAIYYAGLAWSAWRRTPAIRWLATFCFWAGAGFAVITAALCGVSYLLDGRLAFWGPSISQTRNLTTTFKWPDLPIVTGGRLAPWLWSVAAALVAVIALAPSRLRQEFKGSNAAALLLSVNLTLGVAYMAYMQSRGIPLLGYYHHAAYLLPLAFLAIGTSFWPAANRMSPRLYALTCGAAAVMFGAGWTAVHWSWILAASAALGAGLLLREHPFGTWLALGGFAILTAHAQSDTAGMHGSRAEYKRVFSARDRVEALRRGGVVRFWFDDRDPASLDFWALNNTYLAEVTEIGTDFPRGGCAARIDPETLVVVSSSLPDVAAVAQRALAACWQPWGMKPALLEADSAQRGSQPYTMVLLRADVDRSRTRPLRVAFDARGNASLEFAEKPAPAALPRERWKITPQPADAATIHDTADGALVRTPRSAYGFALEFPKLAVPATGRYRFALHYRQRSGQFAFGARPADDSRYLAADTVGHPVDGAREMAFWLDLNRGDEVLLRIANNNNSGDGAASFLMGDVTAEEVDR